MSLFLLLIPILAGWGMGVFVNYLSDVLPRTRRLSSPVCTSCGAEFSWKEYILLRPCASCGHTRGRRAWIVQIASVFLAFYLWFAPQPRWGFFLSLLAMAYFAVVFVIDVEYRLVLHPVSLAGVVLGALLGVLLHGVVPTLVGGAAGFGIMYVLYYLGVLFSRYVSKRRGTPIEEGDALGFGDVTLAGVLGLFLGWPLIWLGVLSAILLGGVVSLGVLLWMLISKRYEAFMAIPYAPFLILSAVYLLFFF